jgi:oligopeptide transport system ATP-binding protein
VPRADTLTPPMPLLTVTDLRTHFHTRNGIYRAVDGVSFSVERGETLGIVGESGSGKSVTCYSIMGLIPQPPGRIESGSAMFDGVDLLRCAPKVARSIRGKRVSMIFQDPMTSLNPYLRVSEQVIEPLLIHDKISKKEALSRALEMMEAVGINDAAKRIHFYPHEFSGGMRQRVMIAMALITRPELLIADEPTTALDVTVQAQILDLIKDPLHPYTRGLQRSIPGLQPKGKELFTIQGLPPDVSKPIPGCAFAARCSFTAEECVAARPELVEVKPGHSHACIRSQKGEINVAAIQ